MAARRVATRRTWLAAGTAAGIGFGAVTGLGVFLGFPAAGAVIAGVVAGVLLGGVLLAAAWRAAAVGATDGPPAAGPTGTDGRAAARDEPR